MKWICLLVMTAFLSISANAQESAETETDEVTPQMQRMEARLEAMQALMAQIQATEDPAERRRLIAEHRRNMRENMTMMGELMQGPRAGGGRMARMRQCAQEDSACRMEQMQTQQRMMGRQMGMMQQMMQQMMEHMSQENGD